MTPTPTNYQLLGPFLGYATVVVVGISLLRRHGAQSSLLQPRLSSAEITGEVGSMTSTNGEWRQDNRVGRRPAHVTTTSLSRR